jgi:hypothetical protein
MKRKAQEPKENPVQKKKAEAVEEEVPKAGKGKAKKAATAPKAAAEASRKSARDKKAPASYSEDAIVKAQEDRIEEEMVRGLRYRAPMDPPGMKSTAYLCKHPCGMHTQHHVHYSSFSSCVPIMHIFRLLKNNKKKMFSVKCA